MNITPFPKLNGLDKITMETTALKLMEEAGELAQAISKFRGLNGEANVTPEPEAVKLIVGELLDVMQVCATMTFVIEDKYGVDTSKALDEHLEKLRKKGYLK